MYVQYVRLIIAKKKQTNVDRVFQESFSLKKRQRVPSRLCRLSDGFSDIHPKKSLPSLSEILASLQGSSLYPSFPGKDEKY